MATVKKPAKKMQMGGDTSMMKKGGILKPVDKTEKPGLAKLPTAVRNKMGYQENGGMTKAKKGTAVKKAENGIATPSLRRGQMKRLGRISAKNPARADRVASRMIERDTRTERGEMFVNKKLSAERAKAKGMKNGGKMEAGGKMKKAMMGTMAKPMMKSGGKATKKCMTGCK